MKQALVGRDVKYDVIDVGCAMFILDAMATCLCGIAAAGVVIAAVNGH